MQQYAQNNFSVNTKAVVMYIDMNSFFASCEQQDNEALRGMAIGVITHDSPFACVIAPSIEAKKKGVKTGMRLPDCKQLCPEIIPVLSRPSEYRKYHIKIMEVLRRYCDDVLAKSIDEAVMNFTSYKLVYDDFKEVARTIKQGIKESCGEFVKCSIGIAPNSFLAKLGTELQKPDGLIEITPENIDGYLARLSLTDLPGIAKNNEKKLKLIGLKTPLEMRHASEALLRKAFGGIVGNYWHYRLNFSEVDLYRNSYRAMSAARTLSRQQASAKQTLESMLISLCTRLEQRMVKQKVFCRDLSFFIRYRNSTNWDTRVRFAQPVQDATEMRTYILQKIDEYERSHGAEIFNKETLHMGVAISSFIQSSLVQYGLFDNNMQKDKLRVVMYGIKDKYGRDIVRKASEAIQPNVMKDAIGFGSVRDLSEDDTSHFNQYLLEP
jgi:DNA polymerase-4